MGRQTLDQSLKTCCQSQALPSWTSSILLTSLLRASFHMPLPCPPRVRSHSLLHQSSSSTHGHCLRVCGARPRATQPTTFASSKVCPPCRLSRRRQHSSRPTTWSFSV